ncbi:MAG: S8 family peptidase [Prevotella sp.]|jgi:subtilisin family serine protease
MNLNHISLLTVLFGLIFSIHLSASEWNIDSKIPSPTGRLYLYRVSLIDKADSPYRLDKPQEFLSERSLSRRLRQGISVDSTDLPVSPRYLRKISSQKVKVLGKSKWNNTVLVSVSDSAEVATLKALPFVKAVKLVQVTPDSIQLSRRSDYKESFNSWDSIKGNSYGASFKQIEMLNGIRLHEAGFRGKGMLITVVDGGFMNVDRIKTFCDIRIYGTRDFVKPQVGEFFSASDHGTKTLSAMAVNQPHIYIGTAPDAAYLLARSENVQTESLVEEDYWAEAVEWADSMGTDIINSSLGYHSFDDKSMNYKYSQQDGITAYISQTASRLADKGIILVNSAGNDGMRSWKRINFPADARNILTVGAVDAGLENAAFSSIGPSADGRIKPDVMAQGSPAAVIDGRGNISHDMGTSFSTPLVCGMVACLWQALPQKTAKQIIQLVRNSASNIATPDNIYGYGIPDFWKAYQEGISK